MRTLIVGDKTEDDSLVILDEDRLCYSVKSVSNGGVGVRTISKALLEEWVAAYKATPNASSQTIREQLVGKSEIDRFEYGYAGTLAKMAKMILGQIPVVQPNAEEQQRKAFYDWMVSNGKATGYAKDVAQTYLPSISNEPKQPSKSMWHGLREYLYGQKPSKRILEVTSYEELFGLYSGVEQVFGQDSSPGTYDAAKFQACWNWAHSPDNHNSVSAAWNLYKQFLKWRDAKPKEPSSEKPTETRSLDMLSGALELFTEKRTSSPLGSGKSYDEIYAETRSEAARIDGNYLVACNYDVFRKTLNDRQVANAYFSKHTDDEKKLLGDFIAAVRQDPKDISFYLTEANRPQVPGIGDTMLTAFLTRTRPDLFGFYTNQMFESVKFLGLTNDLKLPDLTPDSYNTYKGIQTTIRDRMREMGIKAENGNDADYLTVNEFTWFVSENKDLIKEQVMSKQWKPVNSATAKKSGTKKLSEALANDEMLKRLAAALRTKPFAILAGHSGTGKSQLVRRLAYMTCNNDNLVKEGEGKTAPGNYCMVQVKPNWHDSSDLLGYYSEMNGRHFVNTPFVEFICKAYAYPDTPFFVCLDEMNLAPVEQYFAEYLSAIESMEKKGNDWLTDPLVEVDKTGEKDENGREKVDLEIVDQIMKGAASTEAATWIQAHGLTIPKNLFVVGTVNMDETTCQFSRKVLDRAMTLLMVDAKFGTMSTGKKPSEEELLDDDGVKFFFEGDVRGDVGSTEATLLDGVNESLKNTAFVIAYRFANEYALYEAAWAKLKGVDLSTASEEDRKKLAEEALDHVVLMKLLPRIHGERRIVEGIFNGRKGKGAESGKDLPGLKDKVSGGFSTKMMDDILARSDEYLTFWP